MCDYKKMRKWLIIIPTCVLHIFGEPSIISNLVLQNIFSKDYVTSNFFDINSCDEEDSCKRDLRMFDSSKNFDQEGFFTENSGNNFLKNFIDQIKNRNNNLSKEVIICDNRIDKIDREFFESCCSRDRNIYEKPSVIFA